MPVIVNLVLMYTWGLLNVSFIMLQEPLRKHFHRPSLVMETGAVDGLARGLLATHSREMDNVVSPEVC